VKEEAINCYDHVVLVVEKLNTNMEHCEIKTGEWGTDVIEEKSIKLSLSPP
jgi:hypothetical protein